MTNPSLDPLWKKKVLLKLRRPENSNDVVLYSGRLQRKAIPDFKRKHAL